MIDAILSCKNRKTLEDTLKVRKTAWVRLKEEGKSEWCSIYTHAVLGLLLLCSGFSNRIPFLLTWQLFHHYCESAFLCLFVASVITDFLPHFSLFPGLCFSIAYTLLPSLQQSSFLSSLPTFYFLFSAVLRRHLDDLLYHGCLTLCLRSPPEQLVGLERSNP